MTTETEALLRRVRELELKIERLEARLRKIIEAATGQTDE